MSGLTGHLPVCRTCGRKPVWSHVMRNTLKCPTATSEGDTVECASPVTRSSKGGAENAWQERHGLLQDPEIVITFFEPKPSDVRHIGDVVRSMELGMTAVGRKMLL